MSPATTRRRKYSPQLPAVSTSKFAGPPNPPETTPYRSKSRPKLKSSRLEKDTAHIHPPRRSSRIADKAKKSDSNVQFQPSHQPATHNINAQPARNIVLNSKLAVTQQPPQQNQVFAAEPPISQAAAIQPQQNLPEGNFEELLKVVLPASLRVYPWLTTLKPKNPPDEQNNLDDLYNMANLAAAARSSTNPTEFTESDATTLARQGKARAKTVAQRIKQLNARNVLTAPDTNAESGKVAEMLGLAMREQIIPSQKHLKLLFKILRDCLDTESKLTGDLERYRLFETFRHQLNEALPSCGMFTITAEDFESDKVYANECQEALLQRTILLSTIDRWRLGPNFLYDCEASWQVAKEHVLTPVGRTSDSSILTNPKPDLAVYFSFASICHHRFMASNIYPIMDSAYFHCIHPDGRGNRCFPFLFIEAKKSDDSLIVASLDCIHEASQALQNIYACMKKAGTTSDIEKVRIFSISLNANHFDVRVHYAEKNAYDPNNLSFHHTMAGERTTYNRDNICNTVNSILRKHALPVLQPLLESTFEHLMRAISIQEWGQEKTSKVFGSSDLVAAADATQEAGTATEATKTTGGVVDLTEDTSADASLPALATRSDPTPGHRRNRSSETQSGATMGKKRKGEPPGVVEDQPTNTRDSFGASGLAM